MVDFNVSGETMSLYRLRREEESTTSIDIVLNVQSEEREILAKLAFERPTQCVLRQSSAMPSATAVAQTAPMSRS